MKISLLSGMSFAVLGVWLLAARPVVADDAVTPPASVDPPVVTDPPGPPPMGPPDQADITKPDAAQRAADRAAHRLAHEEAMKAMVQTRLLQLFDANGDGALDSTEQAKADAFLQALRGKNAKGPLNPAIEARLLQRFGQGTGQLTDSQLKRAQDFVTRIQARIAAGQTANTALTGGPAGRGRHGGGPGGPGDGPAGFGGGPGGPGGGPGGFGGGPGGPGGGPGGFGGGPGGPGGFGAGPGGGPGPGGGGPHGGPRGR